MANDNLVLLNFASFRNGRWIFSSSNQVPKPKDFRIHDLRHTCAAWLVSKGVPLSEVKELLGHSTINMTERYAHLAPENARAAVAVLDGESLFGHGAQKDDAEVAEGTSPSV